MNRLYRIFCWASGARIYLLEKAPSEWNKYLGIGIIIVLTGIMAGLSGAYALFTVFREPVTAIALGLFWGLFVFFLDWFFIASMKDSGHNLRIVLPRLLLGVFLAFVIAKPLELRLFQKEIKQQLIKEQQSEQKSFKQQVREKYPELTELKKENTALKKEIERKEARRQKLYSKIIAEAEGRSPTGIEGKGPVYKEKKQEFDRITAELEALKARNQKLIEENKEQVAAIKAKIEGEMQKHQSLNNLQAGFLEQFRAFRSIAGQNQVIQAMNIFIILLFILVEISPILVKILAPAGPYDKLLEAEELRTHNKAKAVKKKAATELKQNALLEEELAEMDYNYKVEQKRDWLTKKQEAGKKLNTAYINYWKKKTMAKWHGDGNSSGDDSTKTAEQQERET